MSLSHPHRGPRVHGLRAVLLGALVCLGAAACGDNNILQQDAPSRVGVDQLNNPANAGLLVNSAVGDFECALAQYIVATGRVSDELGDAQFFEEGWNYDRRTVRPFLLDYATVTCELGVQNPGIYAPVSIARFQADDALRRLDAWTDEQVPSRDSLISVAATFAGYSLVLMGETFCTSAIDVGPELTPAQLFTEAESRFTRAIAAATAGNNAEILSLAYLGRARARRGLNRLTDASADAALVPPGFEYDATYSSAAVRRENRVYAQFFRDAASTVEPSFRDLTVDGVPDPRVVVIDAGFEGQDTFTPIFAATKYPAVDSPIPIGRYEEAQLIIAEAELEAGNPNGAIAIIDALRSAVGLPAYSGATDAAAVRSALVEERRHELFLEGHRLADQIRYQLPLDPAPGTPYETSFGDKGGSYGSQLCFPLPDVERNNNPNIGSGSGS